MGEFARPEVAVFFFLAVGSLALFGFLAVATWSGSRASERIAYYENDMLKKLADSTEEGAKQAFEFLREQKRIEAHSRREGLKMGGLVTAAVGAALLVVPRGSIPMGPVLLASLIPLFIGIAMLVYVYAMASKEQP
ncbi:MAG TPA: hypothetical protein VHX11_11840 [Acidobacteriaceae bacterium]|nr:hypothetical protein [Acidobacteriaceae bacterium]